MNTKIHEFVYKLKDSYNGSPWYGDSIAKTLATIDYKTASLPPTAGFNSIAKILQHLINWNVFAVRKIQGDIDFIIEQNDKNDWISVTINSEDDWKELINRFEESIKKLNNSLKNKNDDFLDNEVPKKPYNFGYLIEGIIQHNIYHLGQITLIKKWIKN